MLKCNLPYSSFFNLLLLLLLLIYYYLKYLGSLLTDQNYIQEEIKCRLKAGNSCYYSVQTLLSSRLLSKNLKIKIYKTIIVSGCYMVVKHGLLH